MAHRSQHFAALVLWAFLFLIAGNVACVAARSIAAQADQSLPLGAHHAKGTLVDRESRSLLAHRKRKGTPVGMQPPQSLGSAENPNDGAPHNHSINYWKGSVMTQPVHIYIVWYGHFLEVQKNVFRNFIKSIVPNKDPKVTVPLWYNINRNYYDSTGTHVSPYVYLKGEYDNNYSRGKTLEKSQGVFEIIEEAMGHGVFPVDSDAIYFVLSDAEVDQIGNIGSDYDRFCEQYCGWHSFVQHGDTRITYSWVGDASKQCPKRCVSNPFKKANKSLSGFLGIDSMIDGFAHELVETVADPSGLGWWHAGDQAAGESGGENADLCAWDYGKVHHTPSGAPYNLVGVGNTKYLVPLNFDPVTQKCLLTTPYKSAPTATPSSKPYVPGPKCAPRDHCFSITLPASDCPIKSSASDKGCFTNPGCCRAANSTGHVQYTCQELSRSKLPASFPSCTEDIDCDVGCFLQPACCSGRCTELYENPFACGRCGNECYVGQTCFCTDNSCSCAYHDA